MLVTIGWCLSTKGHTHPLGNFSINRYSRLVPEAKSLSVFYVVDIAEIPTLQEKGSIDTDQDGQISDREKKRYLERKAAELPQGLKVLVNNQPVRLEVRSKKIIVTSERLFLPTLRIELDLEARLPKASHDAPIEIIYEDNNYSERLGWKEIIAKAGSKVSIIESSVPETDLSDALRSYPEDLLNKLPDLSSARFTVVPGTGSAVSSDDRPAVTAAPSLRRPKIAARAAPPARAFHRLDLRELAFPEAQDIGGHPGDGAVNNRGALPVLVLFPSNGLRLGIGDGLFTEHMGMATDHLVADGRDHILEREPARLARHLGVIDDLKEQVTQLVLDPALIAGLLEFGIQFVEFFLNLFPGPISIRPIETYARGSLL